MTDFHDTPPALLDPAAQRRAERRRFLQLAGGASVAAGGLALLAACGGGDDDSPTPTPSPTPSPTPTPTSTSNVDQAPLNLALQLEYLQAQFFAFATTGAGLEAGLLTGKGTPGSATGGGAVPFADPLVAAAAREIAEAARARVAWIRTTLAADAVAQPTINLSGGADGAFTAIARTATVVGAGGSFNPYADDTSFLLGAYLLQDVIVTAYKGLAPLIALAATRTGVVGITAAQAYHAGWLRTSLYARGATTQGQAGLFSNARDGLDGAADYDQGVAAADGSANITPADGNGIAYSRSTEQVLNILYLNKAAVTAGGFFPAGLNGDLKTSAANS